MLKHDMRISQLSATWLKYLSAAILVFIPLYPKFPLFFLPRSTVAVRAEDFLLVFGALSLFAYISIHKLWRKIPLFFPVLAFFGTGLVSSLSAILITQNVSPALVIFHFLRRFEYLLVFYIIYFTARHSAQNKRFILELIIFPFVGVFLYGLAQIYLHAPVISTMNAESSKGIALTLQPGVQLSSTFAGHYDLAIYLAMIIITLFACVINIKKNFALTLGCLITTICGVWLFMRAGSRIGLLGLGVSLLALSLSLKKFKWGIVYLTLVLAMVFTSQNLLNRMGNLIKILKPTTINWVTPVLAQDRAVQSDRSTSIRLDVEWPEAIRALYKNPLLGTGYSSLGLATDNDYLRSIGETGILGFSSFLLLLAAVSKGILGSFMQKSDSIEKIISVSSFGVLIFFLICAVFLDVFESSKIAIMFWVFAGSSFSLKKSI